MALEYKVLEKLSNDCLLVTNSSNTYLIAFDGAIVIPSPDKKVGYVKNIGTSLQNFIEELNKRNAVGDVLPELRLSVFGTFLCYKDCNGRADLSKEDFYGSIYNLLSKFSEAIDTNAVFTIAQKKHMKSELGLVLLEAIAENSKKYPLRDIFS